MNLKWVVLIGPNWPCAAQLQFKPSKTWVEFELTKLDLDLVPLIFTHISSPLSSLACPLSFSLSSPHPLLLVPSHFLYSFPSSTPHSQKRPVRSHYQHLKLRISANLNNMKSNQKLITKMAIWCWKSQVSSQNQTSNGGKFSLKSPSSFPYSFFMIDRF